MRNLDFKIHVAIFVPTTIRLSLYEKGSADDPNFQLIHARVQLKLWNPNYLGQNYFSFIANTLNLKYFSRLKLTDSQQCKYKELEAPDWQRRPE